MEGTAFFDGKTLCIAERGAIQKVREHLDEDRLERIMEIAQNGEQIHLGDPTIQNIESMSQNR